MNYRVQAATLLKDIRFWIFFFFLIRMYGITFPPLEIGQNWRQTDGLMVARNFYERNANILYPTVDVAGEKTGIVGCEFPILNYLVYLVSLIFGYQHWYGRLIVLVTSSIGIFFFYKLIKKYVDESTAFNAAIIVLVSLWFSYTRKNIPDGFAVSLCIIGVYHALRYFDSGKLWFLVLFFILSILGCLSKILTASVLTILLLPMLDRQVLMVRKAVLSVLSFIILGAVYYWYFIWVPHLNATFGFGSHFFMGLSYSEGLSAIIENWTGVSGRFAGTALKYIGFITFLVSLVYVIYKKLWFPLALFSIPFFAYMVMFLKTGSYVTFDTYYMITVIPAMAFMAGFGLARLKNKKYMIAILIFISVEGIADQIYDFRIRQPYRSLDTLEAIMDSVSNRDELIAINSHGRPTEMYFAHRRGWMLDNASVTNAAVVADIISKGCRYIVIVKQMYDDVNLEYPIVHESEYFRIYSLK